MKIQVAGSGKKLRGLRHGPYRPDLVVLDDIENDEAVRNPDMRDKLEGWLKKTVLHLGGVGQKFDVVYIGTILHYDSVLNRTLNNPMWHSARFKAMLKWPDNMALWDEWETILRNNGKAGEAMAQAFYEAHEAAMTAGAQTSWAARGVLDLMKIRARDGHAAFDSELQNDPVSGEDAVFAHILDKCYYKPSEIPPDAVRFGALDPSLGKAGASRDPSAILVGAFDRKTGILYVEVAQIKKRLPDLIIEDVIALQAKHKCKVWAVETVQFQEFLKTELVKRSAARGIPVPARAVKPIRRGGGCGAADGMGEGRGRRAGLGAQIRRQRLRPTGRRHQEHQYVHRGNAAGVQGRGLCRRIDEPVDRRDQRCAAGAVADCR